MTETNRMRCGALSPFGVVLGCRLSQQLFGRPLGVWAWVPTMLIFWGAIALLVGSVCGPDAVARWLRRPRGSTLWCALALMAGLLSLPGFIAHWRVLAPPYVLVSWLLFALVNPFFEEGYWRGLVLDTTRGWPGAISVTYSAAWFAVSHPLIWGVHSAALREWAVIPVLMALGVVWAMAYRRNGSLWCSIAGHMCSNLFGLAVPIMLNLYSPMSR